MFVWSFKNGNGRQHRSSGAKTWLLRRASAKTKFPGDTYNVRRGTARRGMSYIQSPRNILQIGRRGQGCFTFKLSFIIIIIIPTRAIVYDC